MNKSKMILAATGGVIGLALLVMLYFVWSAYSAKTAAIEGDDETEGLESVEANASRLSRKEIYPSKASIDSLESNRVAVVEWCNESLKLVAKGDRVYEKTTPAAFKTFIVAEAKRLGAMPGAVNGAMVKPDFAFGPFKEYIAMGNMPAEDKLAEMQRRWDDVATVVEILGKCGIAELTDVQFKDGAEQVEEPTSKNKKKNAAKKPNKGDAKPIMKKPACFRYEISFNARPEVFVNCVNALETCERFVSVDEFSFTREKDVIADAIGGGSGKSEARTSGRRRRRAAAEETQEDENKPKNGVITDPALGTPIQVKMVFSVYDFHSLEEAGEKTEEVKK